MALLLLLPHPVAMGSQVFPRVLGRSTEAFGFDVPGAWWSSGSALPGHPGAGAGVGGDQLNQTSTNDREEAFARVKIDGLLKDAGWNLADGASVLFEEKLADGTESGLRAL